MKNSALQEIIVSIVLIVLLVLFVNPFGLWMPNMFLMLLVLGLLVAFVIFAGFLWRESAGDERENLHRMRAGRAAFLIGAAILVGGIVVQSMQHALDSWLVVALGGMILAKAIGLMHSRITQ